MEFCSLYDSILFLAVGLFFLIFVIGISYHFGYDEADVKVGNYYEGKIKKIVDDYESEMNEIVDRRTKIVLDCFLKTLKSNKEAFGDRGSEFEDYIEKYNPVDLIKEFEKLE
jgi:hypothetical protein